MFGVRLDDNTRRWAESTLKKTTKEYDRLMAHAEEYESTAADIRGEAAQLEIKIENLSEMLDQ